MINLFGGDADGLLISALASQLPEQVNNAVSKKKDDEIGPYTVTPFTRVQGKL